jgi:hypothetical protein
MNPHIRHDEDNEDSCFANLLLYFPWPPLGEKDIISPFKTAREKFKSLLANKLIPTYLQKIFSRRLSI